MIVSTEMEKYDYGKGHPMKPERISMTFDLLNNFHLLDKFSNYQAVMCKTEDLLVFHTEEYVSFMKNYEQLNLYQQMNNPHRINTSEDVPGFPHFYEFAKLVGGSSLVSANLLSEGNHDIVINWLGGLHHAHPNYASGFCYINDCVLAIK